MLKLGKLKIHSSFFFVMIIIIALGQIKGFFLLVAVTTLHELSHAIAAKIFGLPLESILITPIGEAAYLEGFDALPAYKKNIVLLVGPLANILPAIILLFCLRQHDRSVSGFIYISLTIGFFNLLPVYPLDGGKLLFIFLGNKRGILNSTATVKVFTKIGIAMLFLFGFVQLVLFPFNLSLIAIGIFLISVFEREKSAMVFSYYKCMLAKPRRPGAHTVKTAVFDAGSTVEAVERIFTWDYFHVIYVLHEGGITAILTERQIFEAIIKHGKAGETKLLDILVNNDIIGDENKQYYFGN